MPQKRLRHSTQTTAGVDHVESVSSTPLSAYFDTLIARGEWVPGIKLPSERELAERFGTSRGAVRKTVDAFVTQGLLKRVAGSGTFVIATPKPAATSSENDEMIHVSPAELMEARFLFEPQLPGLIVRHATARDFDRIEDILAASEQASSNAEFEHFDGEFHQAMAHATHNSFVIAVVELMTAVREGGEWGRLKERALTAARRRLYHDQHRKILFALRERDEIKAVRALTEHLNEARTNLFGESR